MPDIKKGQRVQFQGEGVVTARTALWLDVLVDGLVVTLPLSALGVRIEAIPEPFKDGDVVRGTGRVHPSTLVRVRQNSRWFAPGAAGSQLGDDAAIRDWLEKGYVVLLGPVTP